MVFLSAPLACPLLLKRETLILLLLRGFQGYEIRVDGTTTMPESAVPKVRTAAAALSPRVLSGGGGRSQGGAVPGRALQGSVQQRWLGLGVRRAAGLG